MSEELFIVRETEVSPGKWRREYVPIPATIVNEQEGIVKSQIHGPADESRQYYAQGNGDAVYVAQPNATNVWDMPITAAMVGADGKVQMQGGDYETDGNVEDGDYLEFAVMDIDNILSYGANFELAKYVKKRALNKNQTKAIDPRQASDLIQGLYLRTIYVAVNSGVARRLIVNFDMAK